MKKILFLAILLFSGSLFAQNIADQLDEIKPPSNPALTLMGVQPLEINQPKTLNQLETTISNAYDGGGLAGIPDDFGLEVMPAWLQSRPEKIFDRDAMAKNEIAPWDNLALSLASVNREINDSTSVTQIGFGFRTLIFAGKVSDKNLAMFDSLNSVLEIKLGKSVSLLFAIDDADYTKTYNDLLKTLKSEYAAWEANGGDESQVSTAVVDLMFKNTTQGKDLSANVEDADGLAKSMKAFVDGLVNSEETVALANSVRDSRVRKTGFRWEIAAATYLDFPTGEIEFSVVPKVGAWTTLSYSLPKYNLDVSALGRYIVDFQLEEDTWNFDVGGALSFSPGKLSVSGEVIQRFQTATVIRTLEEDGVDFVAEDDKRQDYRAAFNASYRFKDNMIISYSLGKRFDFSDGFQENLLSMLSLNLGFGNVPLVAAAQKAGIL